MANPLILAPQTCIVAIGKLQIVGKYNKDTNQFMPRSVINVSFGCDHRIIDGATVAKFTN
jgi:2-oxoisovalerate dehydrogenase E2 component (dihydrolipoyl transacylase)